MYIVFFFFFFSSRRRHTRLTCDWSSDVCSSDLARGARARRGAARERLAQRRGAVAVDGVARSEERRVGKERRRRRRSRDLYKPPVTSRKLATPEAGGPTLVEGDGEGGASEWDEL